MQEVLSLVVQLLTMAHNTQCLHWTLNCRRLLQREGQLANKLGHAAGIYSTPGSAALSTFSLSPRVSFFLFFLILFLHGFSFFSSFFLIFFSPISSYFFMFFCECGMCCDVFPGLQQRSEGPVARQGERKRHRPQVALCVSLVRWVKVGRGRMEEGVR